MNFRSFLYALARLIGDFNALRRGPRAVGQRVKRRLVGKWIGRTVMRKL